MPRLVKDIELFEVAVRVVAAGEDEVPGKQRAAFLEYTENVGIGHAFIYIMRRLSARHPEQFRIGHIRLFQCPDCFLLFPAFVQTVLDLQLNIFKRGLQRETSYQQWTTAKVLIDTHEVSLPGRPHGVYNCARICDFDT